MNSKKNFFDDREKRIRMPDKGRKKVQKHKHHLLDMASTLPLDDDAFEDYIDVELEHLSKTKRR